MILQRMIPVGLMAFLPANMLAFEGEVFCENEGDPSTEVTERWSDADLQNGLLFKVRRDLAVCGGFSPLAPGFPGDGMCLTPSGSQAQEDLPFHAEPYKGSQCLGDRGGAGRVRAPVTGHVLVPDGDLDFLCRMAWMTRTPSRPSSQRRSGTANGGPFVLGLTDVYVDTTTGLIEEADIALNAKSESTPGVPDHSFLEFNEDYAIWLGSTPGFSWVGPAYAYVDLLGVLTHELGHALGLGHSLVDSIQLPSSVSGLGMQDEPGSLFPTMFPYAQPEELFVEVHSLFGGGHCCTPPFTTQCVESFDVPGGFLGRSASTLELDDLVSLGALYSAPGSSFETELGTIRGIVQLDGTLQPGVHVVAVDVLDASKNRVGVLSKSGGAYEIPGLPPSTYYLFAEPVNQAPRLPEAFFDNLVVPNYVSQIPGFLGCATSALDFGVDYWDDTNEVDLGPVQPEPGQIATPVVVGAGTEEVRNFLLHSAAPNTMTICQDDDCTESPRGVILQVDNSEDPRFRIYIDAPEEDWPVLLYIGVDRGTFLPFQGQLFEVPTSGEILALNCVVGSTFPVNGFCYQDGQHRVVEADVELFDGPSQYKAAFRNFFAQAVVFKPGEGLQYMTNVVSLWVPNT